MTIKFRPHRSRNIRKSLLAAALALAATPLYAVNATWSLGTDGHWSGGGGPNDNTFDVFINSTATNVTVLLDTRTTINTLTVDAGDTLNMNNGRSLILGGITNNGLISNNGITSNANLKLNGLTPMILGSGRITLTSDPQSRLVGSGSPMITNGAGHTIGGGGVLLDNLAGMINNGTILADQTVALTIDPDALGFVNNQTLRATGAEEIRLDEGTHTNAAGGKIFVESLVTVLSDATLTNDFGATILGTGTLNVAATAGLINNGTVAPGLSPGVLNLTGNYIGSATATLVFEAQTPSTSTPIAGTDHDQLNISAGATLAGTLDVDLLTALPAERPDLGTEFDVMTYDTRTGMFSAIVDTLIATDFAMAPLFTDTDVVPDMIDDTLILRASIPGDTNLDNTVSIADLSTFALNFGTTPGL